MSHNIFASMRARVVAGAARRRARPARGGGGAGGGDAGARTRAWRHGHQRRPGRRQGRPAQAAGDRRRAGGGAAGRSASGRGRRGRPRFRQSAAARPMPGATCCRSILRAGEAYGDSDIGAGVRINVEYVSANPTGPMHIGHCRGAVVGDALANLLAKVGHDVTKEFYVNDAGNQVTALAWAAYLRYLQALGMPITEAEFTDDVPGGLQYRGDYLVPVGAGAGGAVRHRAARRRRLDRRAGILADRRCATSPLPMMLEQITRRSGRPRRACMTCSSASGIWSKQAKCDEAIARLAAEGLVYQGTLEPPKGKTIDDWEPREQTAVPRHRVRRRRRSSAAEIRWQFHLFRQRHRLPRGQDGARLRPDDRCLGRRPWRLRQAHAGGRPARSAARWTWCCARSCMC